MLYMCFFIYSKCKSEEIGIEPASSLLKLNHNLSSKSRKYIRWNKGTKTTVGDVVKGK